MQAEFGAFVAPYLDDIFSACSVVVLQRGTLVLSGAWGRVAPSETDAPTTPETRFDLASVTKLFVESTLLSLLSEADGITLKTPLVEVLPAFDSPPRAIEGGKDPHTKVTLSVPPTLQGATVDVRRVQLWQLITHTSGLAAWMDVYNTAGAAPTPPDVPDPTPAQERWARAQAWLMRAPFIDHVGANVHYSDIGLMLVGAVIERLSGLPLSEAIQARVLAPLGIASDVAYNPYAAGVPLEAIAATEIDSTWRRRRVWGQVHDENACGLGGVAGHAGLFGTAAAVATFGEAWRTRDERLRIGRALMDAAVVNQSGTLENPYGYGWVLKSPQGSSAGDLFSADSFGHTGFTGTSLWIDPQRGLVVALLTNRVYMGREKAGIHEFRRAAHDWIAARLS